jgi:hypothetical protein
MKQLLIAIAMVLTLSMNADAAAQKHRHTPRTEQVDTTKTKDAIEAFSDTTAVDANDSVNKSRVTRTVTVSTTGIDDPDGFFNDVFGNVSDGRVFGVIALVLGILFILFVLFPIIVISMVVYFINRNRRQRYKLAQMAMEKGQPIPDHIFKEEAKENSDDYQSGMRQMFTGIGLAIFLGLIIGKIGFGIGALVFFIGLGKWFIARQAGPQGNNSQFNNPGNFNNPSNTQNYDKETDAL